MQVSVCPCSEGETGPANACPSTTDADALSGQVPNRSLTRSVCRIFVCKLHRSCRDVRASVLLDIGQPVVETDLQSICIVRVHPPPRNDFRVRAGALNRNRLTVCVMNDTIYREALVRFLAHKKRQVFTQKRTCRHFEAAIVHAVAFRDCGSRRGKRQTEG